MPFERTAVQALLFDLDGTLIDSTADLAASGNWLRVKHGLPAHSVDKVASFVGDGVESLVRRLLERPEGAIEAEIDAFKRHYHDHCLDETRPYPAVAATLEALQARGFRMAVVTNKPERISRHILEGLKVDRRFGSVVGGNSCAHKKPHPEPLLKACAELGCPPAAALMIGDSRVDIEAGKNAQMPTIGILGGIGDEALLRSSAPDILIPNIEALLEAL
jgi:phosphoglycolate phosphatase